MSIIQGAPKLIYDINGNALVALGTLISGEDQTNNRLLIDFATQELTFNLPSLTTKYIDSNALNPLSRYKTFYFNVTTALTWVTSGQPSWQAFASRAAFAQAGGAASQLTTAQVLLGVASNLGAAASTTLPIGLYRMGPQQNAELQWRDSLIGVEFAFPSALTAGAATLYAEIG